MSSDTPLSVMKKAEKPKRKRTRGETTAGPTASSAAGLASSKHLPSLFQTRAHLVLGYCTNHHSVPRSHRLISNSSRVHLSMNNHFSPLLPKQRAETQPGGSDISIQVQPFQRVAATHRLSDLHQGRRPRRLLSVFPAQQNQTRLELLSHKEEEQGQQQPGTHSCADLPALPQDSGFRWVVESELPGFSQGYDSSCGTETNGNVTSSSSLENIQAQGILLRDKVMPSSLQFGRVDKICINYVTHAIGIVSIK